MNQQAQTKAILSVDEVAEMLSLHPQTVRRQLRDGDLKGRKIGKCWLVPVSQFRDLIGDAQREAA